MTFSTKIDQIIIANGQPFGLERMKNEGTHGHVRLVSEARKLFAEILAEAERELRDRFGLDFRAQNPAAYRPDLAQTLNSLGVRNCSLRASISRSTRSHLFGVGSVMRPRP